MNQMKRVALLLLASFLASVAILPAAESNSVPTRKVASKSYRKGKKVRRSKAGHKRRRKAARPSPVV